MCRRRRMCVLSWACCPPFVTGKTRLDMIGSAHHVIRNWLPRSYGKEGWESVTADRQTSPRIDKKSTALKREPHILYGLFLTPLPNSHDNPAHYLGWFEGCFGRAAILQLACCDHW